MLGTLTTQEIDEVLSRNITGRIGCSNAEKMYIVPISFAFNGNYLLAHSREGLKISMMRQHPEVCFQVDEIDDHANWRSVVLWGSYEEITGPRERYYAMKFLVSRLIHQNVSETAGVPEMSGELQQESPAPVIRPVVYRIRIKEKTGRFERR
ncbi:hypothetical protein SAMN04488505_1021114 [Chitinophaga rupis]|uniref:Pyridoxamine 5'-phosphate oxidase n=1 Tax=Chitinophaga rupis TaxID=573321 RepID=A0A1H7T1S7_9BACT|nr:pyridoxamine 5'-phosphate oxidase family protein [Chitinophaga rupis]SEL78753.1 hypothetical protein SAMN04488505_1021114 [Chitinophaga rupis]